MCEDLKLRWLLCFYTITELCQDCRKSCFRRSRFNKSCITAMKIPKNAIFVDVVAFYLRGGRIHNHLLVPVFRWFLESVEFQTMPMTVDNSHDINRNHRFLESSTFLCKREFLTSDYKKAVLSPSRNLISFPRVYGFSFLHVQLLGMTLATKRHDD